MANPEVDRLITELSQILEQNRQKRNAADAMMQGFKQGQTMAESRRRAVGDQQAAGAGASEAAAMAGPGRSAESAAQLSPSTTSTGRSNISQRFTQALDESAPPYEMLRDNDTPMPMRSPADEAALDERKKRFMQNQALSQGRAGPLGGAGMPAPEPAGFGNPDPSKGAAQMQFGPQGYQPQGAPQQQTTLNPEEMATLEALSQRYSFNGR